MADRDSMTLELQITLELDISYSAYMKILFNLETFEKDQDKLHIVDESIRWLKKTRSEGSIEREKLLTQGSNISLIHGLVVRRDRAVLNQVHH